MRRGGEGQCWRTRGWSNSRRGSACGSDTGVSLVVTAVPPATTHVRVSLCFIDAASVLAAAPWRPHFSPPSPSCWCSWRRAFARDSLPVLPRHSLIPSRAPYVCLSLDQVVPGANLLPKILPTAWHQRAPQCVCPSGADSCVLSVRPK